MPERYSDRQLEAVLASVGRRLVVPTGPVDVTAIPPRAAVRKPAQTALLVAAAALVLLLVAGAAIAPVRDAVADWLGIGSTAIERVHAPQADPRGLPSLDADATPVTAAGARAELGQKLPVVRDRRLGPPARLAVPPEGGVLMLWPQGHTTLWLHRDNGEGVIFVKKLLNVRDRVAWIGGLGDAAALIRGGHVLATPARRVAAGRVVIWVADGLERRLESDLPADRMLAVARSVRQPG